MTQQELDALKALADAATPGPWEVEQRSGVVHEGTLSTCAVLTSAEYDMAYLGDDEQSLFDADFIAAARSAVPALVAEVERLMQAGRDMQQQRDEWREEAERLRVEVADLRTMLAAADPDMVWVD